jgi:4-hydroxy-tetrahydrodipicolinate synthase
MQKSTKYKGVIVPMVTPFTENGAIDKTSAQKLINFLLENGTVPFILGTTGECASIPADQRDILVKVLIENKREKVPLISGVNGLTFADTVTEANKYLEWGIDAVVLTLPAYFKLTDDQVFHYFNDLAEQIKGDVILYNIPKTVHMSIPVEVIEKLSHKKNIIGVKDSELNEPRLIQSLEMWGQRTDFFHLVGVNKLMVKGLQLGAQGIVPSTANAAPKLYVELFKSSTGGDREKIESLYNETLEWSALYQKGRTLGESLAALKFVMSEMNLCQPYVMSPLTGLTDEDKSVILKRLSGGFAVPV